MNIQQYYEAKSRESSDINEHLPTLFKYAKECKHITEFGVRSVVSTWAFLAARPQKLKSYDIQYHPNVELARQLAHQEGIDFEYILGDTTKIEIDVTDFLFIDTLHVYEQLKQELHLHGNKASKYIGFHDTTIFAQVGEDGQSRGLWQAIQEFIDTNPHWSIKERFTNNNGLTILSRTPNFTNPSLLASAEAL